MKVPDVLVSGNHRKIREWREKKMFEKTNLRRRDLIDSQKDFNFLKSKFTKEQINELIMINQYEYYPDW